MPSLRRDFAVSAYARSGPSIEAGVDASPWGLGAWLSVNGKVTHWLSSMLSELDYEKFKLTAGDPAGQQIWEALATLVALREWLPQWKDQRVCVKVRGDNVTMLKLVLSMRPSGWRLAIVARELALDVASGSYTPGVAVHTPGIANVVADLLSRQQMPGKPFTLPPSLVGVPETLVRLRDASFMRLVPPLRRRRKWGRTSPHFVSDNKQVIIVV